MFPDEMTFRALQAAFAAREGGFHGTAEAFLGIARDCAWEALEMEHSLYQLAKSASSTGDPRKGTESCSI